MEPIENSSNPSPETTKGPVPISPTPQPSEPVTPTPLNPVPQPTSGAPLNPPPKKSAMKIVFIIIAIIVLVIGGILISTFLLAPNLFKATAPAQITNDPTALSDDSTDNTGSTNTKSVADETLTQDILKAIYISESSSQTLQSNEIVITEVKLISDENKVITEEWSIDIGGVKSVYTVTLKPSSTGGTDYTVVKKKA